MKKRWFILLFPSIVIISFFLPAVKLYIHSGLGPQIAALFPPAISLKDIMLGGAANLPADQLTPLYNIRFEGWLLAAGVILMSLGAAAALMDRKGALHSSLILSVLAAGLFSTFTLQLMNLSNSLLFRLLLGMQAWAYLPLAAGVAQIVCVGVFMKSTRPLSVSDIAWRRAGGILAFLTAASMMLPVFVVSVPDTITASPADAAAMARSSSMIDEMLGSEPSLARIALDKEVFSDVLTGDLAALAPYSADSSNIKGIFTITTSNSSLNISLLTAVILLMVSGVLAFLPKVDRWFPLSMNMAAFIVMAASSLGIMNIGAGDMFTTATRQLIRLGLGHLTVVPMMAALLAGGAALCGVMSVRAANEPHFINPIPAKHHLYLTALLLAAVSLGLMLMPGMEFSFVKPGRSKVQSIVTFSGLQALAMRAPEDILHPKDAKGSLLYEAEAPEGGMNDAAVESAMRGLSASYSALTWISVLSALAGLYTLVSRRHKKLTIAMLLAAFAGRVLTWLLMTAQMPRVIGHAGGTVSLYLSLPLLVFAAFFTNFAGRDTLPKKYKLFLMILPFLAAVFLFSYLPLYGWSYAFFNYKFGLPMSQQEFVGFKWFTEMFANLGHRENIFRVLKNTFGMSGLNLLTSWMPMVFAIFLNEIGKTRFKKSVQIFTTLPNFISWALVFSFGMALFAMDTGIFSKFMLAIGAIDQPVPWLNSPDHIWIKMWAWNTWKGLGWGAIMYLAAISGLDQELYEAAKVDGANRWKQMRYITLPGLLPTFFVLLLLSISNILNNGLEQYMVFQNSMNRHTIEVLDLYVFNITIASKGTTLYSFATAIGILKTIVSVTLLFSANFISKRLRGEAIV